MTSINSIYINMTNMTNMTNSTIDCKNFLNSLVKPTLYSFTSDFYNEYIYLPNANSNKLKYQRLSSNSSKDISKDSKKNMITAKTQLQTQLQTQSETPKPTPNFYNINVKDQLFWCFLMIIKSWDENDLPDTKKRFEFENKEKMQLTELLQKSNTIPWRELKITKTAVYSGLSESINQTTNIHVLKALAFLCEKNIIYKWGKCYISIPGGRAYESQKNNWYIIQKDRTGHKLANDDYAKKIYDEVKKGKYYQVRDVEKPLLSLSAYKAEELHNIAEKFNIIITRENGKFKLKKDIYNEIVELIHKID